MCCHLKGCCCCLSLLAGTRVIAFLALLENLARGYSMGLVKSVLEPESWTLGIGQFAMNVLTILDFVACILLIYTSLKSVTVEVMIPWMVTSSVWVVLMVYLRVEQGSRTDDRVFTLMISLTLAVAWRWYTFAVVTSCAREQRATRSADARQQHKMLPVTAVNNDYV